MFKSLDPHYYQCSRRTTSIEIETVFQRAINRQRSHNSFSLPIRCGKFIIRTYISVSALQSLCCEMKNLIYFKGYKIKSKCMYNSYPN